MNIFDYLFEFLSFDVFEFPEDVLEAWDCIMRMVTSWHILWFLI